MDENYLYHAIGKLESKIDGVADKVNTISEQLEPLKAFRWKIIGVTITISTLIGIVFEILGGIKYGQ